MPPVLPEREPKGATIEVDEGLSGVIDHPMVFTETTQHMDDKVVASALIVATAILLPPTSGSSDCCA